MLPLNKNVIITGGANGIGKALTKKLVAEKAHVAVFDIDEVSLKQLKEEFPEISYYLCDVSKLSDIEKNISDFFNQLGSIDILINNAAIVRDAPLLNVFGEFKKYPLDYWDKTIQINLTSVFLMTREVAEIMFKKRTKGLIINVSSIAAHGNPGQSAYSASKAGVSALTYTWARELNYLGIRVAGVAPGFTETNMSLKSMNDKLRENWKQKTPLKRMATPEEIADGIMFIIKNVFFHGKILELDGGLVIG